MHQYTFTLLGGALDEVKDALRRLIVLVKQDLVLLIEPEEGEVDDTNVLPIVANLLAGTVDDM